MTRNLYLGADIDRPVLAAMTEQARPGHTDASVLAAVANATYESRAIVDRTDFSVRARLLAREIRAHRPDLIGLQEVALWRHGPLELGSGRAGVPNATTIDYDFLAILLEALRRAGMRYQAVAVGDRADVEAPSFGGSAPGADARDVRLTMRDVILKRANNDVTLLGKGDTVYARNLALPVAGVSMSFARGYQWVDVRHGHHRFRFVNTHLESFSSDIACAQAVELLANAPATGRTTVLVCDVNSDPLDHTVKTAIGDTVPHSAPYELIAGPGGFHDEWLRWAPASAGWTAGLSELVDDPTPARIDHRIDMVFARTASGDPVRVDGGRVTGTTTSDRDPTTGLWPSDHGGVVLRLRGL